MPLKLSDLLKEEDPQVKRRGSHLYQRLKPGEELGEEDLYKPNPRTLLTAPPKKWQVKRILPREKIVSGVADYRKKK